MESRFYPVDASLGSVLAYYADGSPAGPDAVNLASAVAIPPGESSTALGIWDTADGYSTQAEFQGNLFNAAQGEQFRGRVVNEISPFGGADGCHSPGDAVEEVTHITGGRWWVQNNNSYKTDRLLPILSSKKRPGTPLRHHSPAANAN